ncbi:MAG: hypothetical protein JWO94_3560 [Verrucomicrobiaceae bacterium]|nr:hypothetical protein [Verrucomicrobiaceae bacterium]
MGKMSEPVDADEVIPPSSRGKGVPLTAPGATASEKHATARIIARWLDELFPIPGTTFRVGLDPIISLVPGVGDIISSSVSFVVMLEAVRTGVSLSVIMRMAFNMIVNALLDMIPGAGPAASIFFKSNSRNLELLRRWQAGQHREVRRGSRLLLTLIVCLCFLVLMALMAVWAFYAWTFARLFGLA